jgi:zinc transporter, ZIP family
MFNLKENSLKLVVMFIVPIVAFGALLWAFVNYGPLGVIEGNFPPIEDVVIERVVFEPDRVTAEVFNNGPTEVTIAQTMINERYWKFSMTPEDNTLAPLASGEINFFYPWVEGDPLLMTVVLSDGVTFDKEVDVSFLTPVFDGDYVQSFVLLGVYVGVIPVLLGLLWLPFIRKLKDKVYMFLLALTVGLLLFLGFDSFAEAIELIPEVPSVFNGVGLIVIGFILAVLILGAVSYFTEHRSVDKANYDKALSWAYLIALGIGVHNMGEGLAIGSAYAIGEIALGSSLVIGFMAHNLTEGIAIISPLTRINISRRGFLKHMIFMGLIAGGPTIIGSLIGGFAYSPILAIFFLAIGAGAIFDVCFDILRYMAGSRWKSLFCLSNVFGFILGLLVMYLTGFLVVG